MRSTTGRGSNAKSRTGRSKAASTSVRRRLTLLLTIAIVLIIIAAVAAWFGSAGWRADQATRFDGESQAALAQQDYQTAFRRADFAHALSPSLERKLALGSLAYLGRDYELSVRWFKAASAAGPSALIGQAAAAGQSGQTKAYDRLKPRLVGTGEEIFNTGLAFAALAAGDLDTAAAIDRHPTTDPGRFALAAGRLRADPEQAVAALAPELCRCNPPTAAISVPAYRAFYEQLIDLPAGAIPALREALARTTSATADATKYTVFAQILLKQSQPRAAEVLAQAAVSAAPLYRDGWQTLAAIQLSRHDHEGAARSLKTALDLDPASGYTWHLKAELANQQHKPDQAAEFAKRARGFGYSD